MEDTTEESPPRYGLRIVNSPNQPTRKIELLRTEVEGIGELVCAEGKTGKYCKQENKIAMVVKDEDLKDGTIMEGKKGATALHGKSETDEELKDGIIMEEADIIRNSETDLDGRYEASSVDGKKEGICHNETCSTINKLVEETTLAINDLANQFSGVSGLLEASLVRDGPFNFRDPLPWDSVPSSDYELARWKLTEAYAKYGKEYKSGVAFQLAVENVIDLICLSYYRELTNFCCNNRKSTVGWHMYKYSGWMVAANMDQQALNFLCYFPERKKLMLSLPFLELANDKDIEGDSYFEMLKENSSPRDSTNGRDGWFSEKWFHAFMIIALVKLKRLLVQVRTDEARWMAFMEGTDKGAGETSTVWSIRGMAPVIEMLEGLVLDQSRNPLTGQIVGLLTAVNERNPFLIPGLLESTTLEGPTFPEVDECREFAAPIPPEWFWDDGETDLDRDIHSARFAVNNYGYAWHMEKDYTDALKLFLYTGSVIPKK